MTDAEIIAEAVAGEEWMRAELQRACKCLVARGVPQDQISQALAAAAEMLQGGTALVEREVARFAGEDIAIH